MYMPKPLVHVAETEACTLTPVEFALIVPFVAREPAFEIVKTSTPVVELLCVLIANVGVPSVVLRAPLTLTPYPSTVDVPRNMLLNPVVSEVLDGSAMKWALVDVALLCWLFEDKNLE